MENANENIYEIEFKCELASCSKMHNKNYDKK